MGLFKKKKKVPIAQLKIQELHTKPRDQILALQKRFDHLQDLHINTDTHVGELKLNADGEIKKIELMIENIKKEMVHIKKGLDHVDHNMAFLIADLNLTTRKDELDRFNHDLERMKLHNYITVEQFEKLVQDMVNS